MPIPNDNRLYTAADYMAFEGEERWELIGGVPYDMSPAPGIKHQLLLLNLYSFLRESLKGKPCIPLTAPVDVVLSNHDVVQPDALVICDRDKIVEGKNIQGAPDLIFEILSPSSRKKDRWTKKILYEASGVREYIVIDPDVETAEQCILGEDGAYPPPARFGRGGEIPLASLGGLPLPLQFVFDIAL